MLLARFTVVTFVRVVVPGAIWWYCWVCPGQFRHAKFTALGEWIESVCAGNCAGAKQFCC